MEGLSYTRNMSRRHKKKRNKSYRGEDAVVEQPKVPEPVVHRYTAVERSKTGEWWHDHKRAVKVGAATGGIGLLIAWMLYELARLVF
jgi:hypothetical protein